MPVELGLKTVFAFLMVVFFGAINTLNQQFQNQRFVKQGSHQKKFYHPYIQNLPVFLAQSFGLLIFSINKKKRPEPYLMEQQEALRKGKILKYNKFKLCVGGFIDTYSAILNAIALNYVAGSIYQMIRGGTVAATFFFYIVYLKKQAKKYQIFGILLTICGAITVGISNALFKTSSSEEQTSQIVGIVFLIVGFFIKGFLLTYEENLYQQYHVDPLQMIGYEGVAGLIFLSSIVAILSIIPCPFGVASCVFLNDSEAYIQRVDIFLREISDDSVLAISFGLGILGFLLYSYYAQLVTKQLSSLLRTTLDALTMILVWGVGIVITLALDDGKQSNTWQVIRWEAIVIQLSGFMLIIVGNLILLKVIEVDRFVSKDKHSQLQEGQLLSQNKETSILHVDK